MINVSELRLGNFVCHYDPKEIFVTCQDEEIRKDVDMVDENLGYLVSIFNGGDFNSASFTAPYEPKDINPIPITEEWLLNLGFENGTTNELKLATHATVSKDGMNEGWWVLYLGHNALHVKFQYVHQLQNLYHSLTGKELNLSYE
jgi:hypothetical protein